MAPSLHARIHGAGPSGALTALALARVGWGVTLVDPLALDQLLDRDRAYALTHSSANLLRDLRLWTSLESALIPFRSLELWDRAIRRRVRFDQSDLPDPLGHRAGGHHPSANTEAGGAVGWILQHRALMALLMQQLINSPAVKLQLGPDGESAAGQALPAGEASADLIVAADGGGSPTRRQAGLSWWEWPYRQACLTAQVSLRGSAEDQAWELFRPEGPLAVLPLGGGRAQVVWSASRSTCRALEELTPSAFLDRLAGVLPDQLQPDALEDQQRSFPVGVALAPRLWRGRTVLLGESAHRCHPVGGQGLNLCWRDTAVLARLAQRVAQGELAPSRLAAAYGRRRRADHLITLVATDLLVRLFSNRHPLLLPLRHLALTLLERLPQLRRLSLAAMTLGSGSARLKPW